MKIKKACCEAKKLLSFNFETALIIESCIGEEDFSYDLSRNEFEKICKPIFDRCFPPVEKALAESQLQKSDIDELVLVGGSSRVPYIQKRLEDFFDGKKLNQQVNPNEAVCQGATIYAGMLAKDASLRQMEFTDVVPLNLATDVEEDGKIIVKPIIPKNTKIPLTMTKKYKTTEDDQDFFDIKVLQGDSYEIEDNHQIA